MLLAERFAPLRRTVESKLRRIVRNLTIGGVSLALTPLLQAPLLQPVASWIVREHVGLLQAVALPRWVEIIIAIVLLDYTLWWWHWANHGVPFFWLSACNHTSVRASPPVCGRGSSSRAAILSLRIERTQDRPTKSSAPPRAPW